MLVHEDTTVKRKFSFDMSDDEAAKYVSEMLRDNVCRLQTLIAANPVAATQCFFHWTVGLVIRTCVNCADTAGAATNAIPVYPDSVVFGQVCAYYGVV